MIKYKIIRNTEAEQLVVNCFSTLEKHGVKELPANLNTGERRIVFKKGNDHITFVHDGNRCGHFILRQELQSGIVAHYTSAQFQY